MSFKYVLFFNGLVTKLSVLMIVIYYCQGKFYECYALYAARAYAYHGGGFTFILPAS
jgi:hypothetical protein